MSNRISAFSYLSFFTIFTLLLLVSSTSYAEPQAFQGAVPTKPATSFNPPSQPGNSNPPNQSQLTYPPTNLGNSSVVGTPVLIRDTALGVSVIQLYKRVIGDTPTDRELENAVDQLRRSPDTRVTMRQIEANLRAGDDFYLLMVEELYRKHLGREKEPSSWYNLIITKLKLRPSFAEFEKSILSSKEYAERWLGRQYSEWLRRCPTEAEYEKLVGGLFSKKVSFDAALNGIKTSPEANLLLTLNKPALKMLCQRGKATEETKEESDHNNIMQCEDVDQKALKAWCELAQFADRPGDFPYSMYHCCAHSAEIFHKACKVTGATCYYIGINNGYIGHALNAVETATKGMCVLFDSTSTGGAQNCNLKPGGSCEPRIGKITFPCGKKPPKEAICQLQGEELKDCKWTVDENLKEPKKAWDISVCRQRFKYSKSLKEEQVNQCAACCTDHTGYFYQNSGAGLEARVAGLTKLELEKSQKPVTDMLKKFNDQFEKLKKEGKLSDELVDELMKDLIDSLPTPSPGDINIIKDKQAITRHWHANCLNACESGYSGPPLAKNPGVRYAADICVPEAKFVREKACKKAMKAMTPQPTSSGAGPVCTEPPASSLDCIKCCDFVAVDSLYPSEESQECRNQCVRELGRPKGLDGRPKGRIVTFMRKLFPKLRQ